MAERKKIHSRYIGEGLVFQLFPHFLMLKNSSINQPLDHSLFLNVQVHLLIYFLFLNVGVSFDHSMCFNA
jgi:hypothetical protein